MISLRGNVLSTKDPLKAQAWKGVGTVLSPPPLGGGRAELGRAVSSPSPLPPPPAAAHSSLGGPEAATSRAPEEWICFGDDASGGRGPPAPALGDTRRLPGTAITAEATVRSASAERYRPGRPFLGLLLLTDFSGRSAAGWGPLFFFALL